MARWLDFNLLLARGGIERIVILIIEKFFKSAWIRALNGKWDREHRLVRQISTRMDGRYSLGETVSGIKLTPKNHRILLPGHTLAESLRIALHIKRDNRAKWYEVVPAWVMALMQDGVSPMGLPWSALSKHIYVRLRKAGVKDGVALQCATISGERVANGLSNMLLSALVLRAAKNDGDLANFSRTLGSMVSGAIFRRSPITAMVALVGVIAASSKEEFEVEALKKAGLESTLGYLVDVARARYGALGFFPALLAVNVVNERVVNGRTVAEQLRGAVMEVRRNSLIGMAFIKGFIRHLRSGESKNSMQKSATTPCWILLDG